MATAIELTQDDQRPAVNDRTVEIMDGECRYQTSETLYVRGASMYAAYTATLDVLSCDESELPPDIDLKLDFYVQPRECEDIRGAVTLHVPAEGVDAFIALIQRVVDKARAHGGLHPTVRLAKA